MKACQSSDQNSSDSPAQRKSLQTSYICTSRWSHLSRSSTTSSLFTLFQHCCFLGHIWHIPLDILILVAFSASIAQQSTTWLTVLPFSIHAQMSIVQRGLPILNCNSPSTPILPIPGSHLLFSIVLTTFYVLYNKCVHFYLPSVICKLHECRKLYHFSVMLSPQNRQ